MRDRSPVWIGLCDMALAILAVVIVAVNPPKPAEAGVKEKGEYLLTIDWSVDEDADATSGSGPLEPLGLVGSFHDLHRKLWQVLGDSLGELPPLVRGIRKHLSKIGYAPKSSTAPARRQGDPG